MSDLIIKMPPPPHKRQRKVKIHILCTATCPYLENLPIRTPFSSECQLNINKYTHFDYTTYC